MNIKLNCSFVFDGFAAPQLKRLAHMNTFVMAILIGANISTVSASDDIASTCATEICTKAKSIKNLPNDVLLFVNRRDGCDHFRGEPWPEEKDSNAEERRKFILKNLNELCTGTDKQLMELRKKYVYDRAISEVLAEYESKIENN